MDTSGMTPKERVAAHWAAAVEYPYNDFRHWNLSIILEHLQKHEEIRDLRDMYYENHRRLEGLQHRKKSLEESIRISQQNLEDINRALKNFDYTTMEAARQHMI